MGGNLAALFKDGEVCGKGFGDSAIVGGTRGMVNAIEGHWGVVLERAHKYEDTRWSDKCGRNVRVTTPPSSCGDQCLLRSINRSLMGERLDRTEE